MAPYEAPYGGSETRVPSSSWAPGSPPRVGWLGPQNCSFLNLESLTSFGGLRFGQNSGIGVFSNSIYIFFVFLDSEGQGGDSRPFWSVSKNYFGLHVHFVSILHQSSALISEDLRYQCPLPSGQGTVPIRCNGEVVAEFGDAVYTMDGEGAFYIAPDCLRMEYFRPSDHRTMSDVKGEARPPPRRGFHPRDLTGNPPCSCVVSTVF